ncbi:DUF2334 domain-containing protein [Ectothiorhodospiraceae bacterium WFHF3C12]|nr:DUF2334 domain-containing protein [Ectothiorhodospiraceae bacterium WFHF3C12]
MANALISIHDVMPETLPQTAAILRLLGHAGIPRATLLVVPGRRWSVADLDTLRYWSRLGHRLAGHGWSHHVDRHRSVHGRLHGRLFSRQAAEHLALDAPGVLHLMHRNYQWFASHDLPRPGLYVPPAWALGALARGDLTRQPFRQIETLTGVYDTASGAFTTLPVIGFEADTPWRAVALRASNALARRLTLGRPLRIAIHPHDPHLRLGEALRRTLARVDRCLHYDELLAHGVVLGARQTAQ